LVNKKLEILEIGKIPNTLLQALVLDKIKIKNSDVVVNPGIGEDCCALDFGEYLCVMSTDPITGTAAEVGRLAVHISCNDIASCGIKPVGLMVTILAPKGTTAQDLETVSDQLNNAANELNIDIIGGHTEVTNAVNRFVLISMAVGKVKKGEMVTTAGAKLGDDIVMTKGVGIEGTAIIAYEKQNELISVLGSDRLDKAKSFMNMLSVVSEGLICGHFGVNSMHDVTEGGLLGAVWEVCEASGKGAEIYEDKILISEETTMICNHYNINPLKLISSGCMLITCKNGKDLVDKLREQEIDAAVIGKIVKTGCFLIDSKNSKKTISQPESDDLYKVLGQFE